MADAETVTLTIGGERHEGWTAVNVTRAIDTMVGSFNLSVTERWADRLDRFALEAGASCTVAIGGQTVLTGYIDTLDPDFDSESHNITIAGRDRAADLIDCSAIARPGSWRGVTLDRIAAELAQPFGVTVTARAPVGPPLRHFALQQGESVQAVIERLGRFAGLLAVSDAAGNVDLIAPAESAPVMALVEGVNILSARATHDVQGRFSTYLIKGQAAGDDHAHGKTVSQPSGSATDPAVKRHRPLLIVAEEQSTLANLAVRAKWEASTRAGRAQTATVSVLGWRRPDGALHAAGSTVTLDSPVLFMSGRMLVQQVAFVLDERGEVAELTVVPPAAWSQLAIPEKAEASRVRDRK